MALLVVRETRPSPNLVTKDRYSPYLASSVRSMGYPPMGYHPIPGAMPYWTETGYRMPPEAIQGWAPPVYQASAAVPRARPGDPYSARMHYHPVSAAPSGYYPPVATSPRSSFQQVPPTSTPPELPQLIAQREQSPKLPMAVYATPASVGSSLMFVGVYENQRSVISVGPTASLAEVKEMIRARLGIREPAMILSYIRGADRVLVHEETDLSMLTQVSEVEIFVKKGSLTNQT